MINTSTISKGRLALLYIFLMLIPAEFYFHIAAIRLEPYRIFLLFVLLFSIPNLVAFRRFSPLEIFLLLYCLCCAFSFIVNHGTRGIVSGMILYLEIFVGYYIGRMVNGDFAFFRIIIKLVLIVNFFLIPFAIVESTNGYRYFHVLFAGFLGNPVVESMGDSYFRHGLHRAGTLFSHPILYSVCAVMFLPLTYFLYKKILATIFSSGIYVAMITSVTSAGFLMVIFQVGLYVLKKISIWQPAIFKWAVYTSVFAYIFLSFLSDRGPILLFIQTMSLNPATAYSRYQQWQFSADDIFSNPILGIGFSEWSRPHWMDTSVDSFWLMTVLQNGVPALVCLGMFFFLSARSYWKIWRQTNNTLYFATFCSIFSIIFAGFTVDFFDRAQLLIFLMIGIYNSFVARIKFQDNESTTYKNSKSNIEFPQVT